MSEFLITSDVSSGLVQAGHQTKRVISGQMDDVRPKLAAALERLGYHVLSEQPFQAKRRGSAKVVGKLNRSTVTLSISLKASSEASTQVTFDYEVASASMYNGDHVTIEREIDAIVALTDRGPHAGVCHSCGTGQASENQYCRVCGAPGTAAEPAELEVLRLDGEIRYGHRANITAVSLMASTAAIGIALIFFGSGKGINLGWALLIMGQVAGFATLLHGNYVVHKALNPRSAARDSLSIPAVANRGNSSLPPRSPALPMSVTEETTQLLQDSQKTGDFTAPDRD